MQQSNDPAVVAGGKAAATAATKRGASRKRVSISRHREEIVQWVGEGYSDEEIARRLGTSASSVQSFRSRAGIRRQPAPASSVDGGGQDRGHGARSTEEASTTGASDAGRAAQATVYEGVLDQGKEQGYGLWLDPAIAGDPLFEKGFAGVTDIRVVIQRHRIILTPNTGSAVKHTSGPGDEEIVDDEAARQLELITDGTSSPSTERSVNTGTPMEQGQVKWFNTQKGYGFILRPDSSRIFFHVSELADGLSPEALAEGRKVSYEVSSNQRGLVAKAIELSE